MRPSPARAGAVVVRIPHLGWSTRVQVRSMVVSVVAMAATSVVFTWSLTLGDFPISVGEALATLVGQGTSESAFIIRDLRLPRALTGLLVGASFGLAGAIFQRIARNPLASPDIIGVNAGAAAAAVFVIVILHGSSSTVTVAALVGGLAAAAAVYVLSYKGGVSGYRLVLIGIGVTAVLGSLTSYLLTRAEIFDAQRATIWLTGSLNNRGWDHVRPVAVALAVLFPLTLVLARQLRALELGDDAAKGLGSPVELVRGGLILAGVVLAAIGTAAAGPIAFVALVAPQIARRLVHGRTTALVPAAAVGALLLVTSDVVARRVLAPTELPVGIVTAIIGAPYLLYLLARANRIGSGG
jgi:iron complex transport system permease protein